MQLPTCTYRVAVERDDGLFFCRHPRVHIAYGLVSDVICRNCDRHSVQCDEPLRPIPDALPTRTWCGFTESALEYISLERMAADARQFAGCLPPNISAVAGVPRSGLLPAGIISVLLHLPLYELSSRFGLRPIGHGTRLDVASQKPGGALLVIDDSVNSGTAMAEARRHAARCASGFSELVFAALYPTPEKIKSVDLYCRVAPLPHLFEWNLLNCNQTRHFATDFDGILCEDWAGGDEEGPDYKQFLQAARPRWLPRRAPIPLIVTARLEKHRDETIRWLTRHGVQVNRLVMGPWSCSQERRRHYSAGHFKGIAYKESSCGLFVESDPVQAREIFEEARKPVLCPAAGMVFQ